MSDQSFLRGLDLTPRASQAVEMANREAQYQGKKRIGPLHIFLGIILLQHCEARLILERDFGLSHLREKMKLIPAKRDTHRGWIPLSHATRLILVAAKSEALRFDQKGVGTEHILLGILFAKRNPAKRVLTKNGVSLAKLRISVNTLR